MSARAWIITAYVVLALGVAVAFAASVHTQNKLRAQEQRLAVTAARLAALSCEEAANAEAWSQLLVLGHVTVNANCEALARRVAAGDLNRQRLTADPVIRLSH